jgi:hypothetical protein
MTLIIHGGCVPANGRVQRKRVKRETYNNRHFDVKPTPEFFDDKLMIYITFRDRTADGSTKALKFRGGKDIDVSHNTEIKPRIAKAGITRITCTSYCN